MPGNKKDATLQENLGPKADIDQEADEQELKEALARTPPINSSYLLLPRKGRLDYVGLHF
jgi:UV DNA damage endonuclease